MLFDFSSDSDDGMSMLYCINCTYVLHVYNN